MEKTTITKEQAEFLNREKQEGKLKHETIKRFVQIYGEHGCDFHLDELIRALYIGYEVEETFKVGDWVHNNVTGRVAKIDDRGYDEEVAWVDDDKVNFFTQFRHATPEEIAEEKQRRWWAKHGREVGELREGDIIRHKLDDELDEVMAMRELVDNFIVVCFVEDRKDVK